MQSTHLYWRLKKYASYSRGFLYRIVNTDMPLRESTVTSLRSPNLQLLLMRRVHVWWRFFTLESRRCTNFHSFSCPLYRFSERVASVPKCSTMLARHRCFIRYNNAQQCSNEFTHFVICSRLRISILALGSRSNRAKPQKEISLGKSYPLWPLLDFDSQSATGLLAHRPSCCCIRYLDGLRTLQGRPPTALIYNKTSAMVVGCAWHRQTLLGGKSMTLATILQ